MHLAPLGNKSQFARKDQVYSSSCFGYILLYFELSVNWNQQKFLYFDMKQSYSVTCSESFTLKSSHCRTRRSQSCRVIHIVNPADRDIDGDRRPPGYTLTLWKGRQESCSLRGTCMYDVCCKDPTPKDLRHHGQSDLLLCNVFVTGTFHVIWWSPLKQIEQTVLHQDVFTLDFI